jgi:hypothetical protein
MRLLCRGWLFVGFDYHDGMHTNTPWCWVRPLNKTFRAGFLYAYMGPQDKAQKFGFGFTSPFAFSKSW